jgi:integrase
MSMDEESSITKEFAAKKLEPGIYRDDKDFGFCLKVTPAGRKVYQVRKRVKGEEQKTTVTIGIHPEITATVARARAQKIIQLMAGGINPNEVEKAKKREAEERKRAKLLEKQAKEVTVGKVLSDYLDTRDLKPGTKYNYKCVVEAYLSDWMTTSLTDIDRDLVINRYQKIIEENGVGAANNTMRVLRALFAYAEHRYEVDKKPIVTENPVTYLSKLRAWQKLPRRQTVLTVHQLKPWYEGVMKLGDPTHQDFFVFLLFTGLRKGEAMSLKWPDVDLDNGTVLIRDTKNRRPHMLPLSDFLSDMLKRRSKSRTSDYVFPGKLKGRMAEPTTLVEEIRKASGITFIPHDLRRTFATVAESLDLSWKTVKSLLNHKMDDDVTAGYVISEAERLRSAMQKITDTIKEIIEDEEGPDTKQAKRGSKVVAISSHRKKDVEF